MEKTITKADIVEHLHTQLGLNKSESKKLIEDFFEEIKKSLENNEEVKLSGFGNFELINLIQFFLNQSFPYNFFFHLYLAH